MADRPDNNVDNNERGDECPSTPGRQLKSPELSTSSSSDEDGMNREDGSYSPPPNCAICLGKCRNKCFTDSCRHMFCFKCLLEWSKVKSECPLCKQTFKSIIHNVKAIDRFEEYLLQPPAAPDPLLAMYNQEIMQGETGNGSMSQRWRRYVYDWKLYALPVPDNSGRLRESTALFYRSDPSQILRLTPWISRDIFCLLRDTEHNVAAVLAQINTMLTTFNILSPEFREHLLPFLGTKTMHFIHELSTFARSQYDMFGYDHVVQYLPSNIGPHAIPYSSPSSAGSDVEFVSSDIQQEVPTTRRDHLANRGGGFNLNATTTSTSAQESAINRGATTSTTGIVSAPSVERPPSATSDECEFVLEQKPPHLRTPELVSLNSDSDSDVVFMRVTKTPPIPNTTATANSTTMQTHDTSDSETDERTTPKILNQDQRMMNAVAEVSHGNVSQLENDKLPKAVEEFNQGASTSTGLQIRYRTRLCLQRDRRDRIESSDSDKKADCGTSSTYSYHSTEEYNSPSDSDTSWSKTRRNSNKQSLKRSRQRKASTQRKTRQQPAASSKSKRTKQSKIKTKTISTESSSSSEEKETAKRPRGKFPRGIATTHRRQCNVPQNYYTTDSEEE